MNCEEKVNSNSRKVECDGGEHGHPLIYLEISTDNEIICPYCGKLFVYRQYEES